MKADKHSSKKTVGIIGHFGGKKVFLDGQTIKTKILYEELRNATDWELFKVDTYYKKERPLGLLLRTLRCLFMTRDVIILLSGNGMKLYFPLLFFFSKHFHTRVYHDVIGGNLDSYVRDNPKFKAYLNSFQANWVETEGLKNRLTALDVTNCSVIPNFKRLQITGEVRKPFSEPYCFCMFSRVMKEKGVETAIDAIQKLNEEAGRIVCRLDIYGRVDDAYRSAFEEKLHMAEASVRYCGTVPYDQSVQTIASYFALLFPTFWQGEGFPGTIVDAFSAGLPVIASDWSCNAEIVRHLKTGIIYPREDFSSLEDSICWAITHADAMAAMRKSCAEEAEKYQPDCYIKLIKETITLAGELDRTSTS